MDAQTLTKRIAVTASSPDLDVEVEPRFGRAPYILLVDPGTLAWEAVEGPGQQARGGAGIKVAQFLSQRDVTDVISGEFGPNAHEALSAAGIAMHRCESGTRAREAVELMKEGKLAGPEPAAPPHRGGRGGGGGRGRGRGRG